MLITKRKKLTRSIAVRLIVAVILIATDVCIGLKIAIKTDEKQIYQAIAEEYSNVVYDKKLARIAEECAEKCYLEKLDTSSIRILENAEFVKLYSTESHIAKYTLKADSDAAFIEKFLMDMKTEKHSATDSCLRECDYIGVGKYKNQVFILAFYND